MTFQLTSDASGFLLNDYPFVPLILEEGGIFQENGPFNAAIVKLSMDASSDLIWEKEKELAKSIVEKKGLVLWELDFGFPKKAVKVSDKMFFSSLVLALDHFSSVLKEFEASTLGAIFYRRDTHFSTHIDWDQQQNENFLAWKEDYPVSTDSLQLKEVYAANVIAEYLHRLLSFLPDHLQAFCLFAYDPSIGPVRFFQRVSKDRFSHFQIAIKGSPFFSSGISWGSGKPFSGIIAKEIMEFPVKKEIEVGICLPGDEMLFNEGREELEEIASYFIENSIPCRILHESMMTQEWQGLETIAVFEKSLTIFGKRQLQGFCAASGQVVVYKDSLGLSKEISFEEYKEKDRSRGI